jgi:hypothetical protein
VSVALADVHGRRYVRLIAGNPRQAPEERVEHVVKTRKSPRGLRREESSDRLPNVST